MALRWYSVVVDCRDLRARARWCAAALHWKVVVLGDPEGDEFCLPSARDR